MLQMEQCPVLSLSPSFNSYYSAKFSEIASKIDEERAIEDQNPSLEEATAAVPAAHLDPTREDAADAENTTKDEDDDFEFAFVARNADGSPISAEEIFSNGRIRPMFPIFNRDLIFSSAAATTTESCSKPDKRGGASNRLPLGKLLMEDRYPPSFSSSSSEADDLEGVPAETYCVWKPRSGPEPSPDRCKKSNSTGSSKRWSFRDLLHRSNSDGKQTFVFLTTEKKGVKAEISKDRRHSIDEKTAGKAKLKAIHSMEKELVASPHEMHYVRSRAIKEGDRRRSFLPYRQDLVGFFSNVNGFGKSVHPF